MPSEYEKHYKALDLDVGFSKEEVKMVEEVGIEKEIEMSSEQPLYEIGALWATRNIHTSN